MHVVGRLRNTNTARWYGSASASGSKWESRMLYYQALLTCAESLPEERIGPTALARAAAHESPSHLYQLFGRTASSRLTGGMPQAASGPAATSPVRNVVVEAKVWSHWPHRTGWLATLATMEVVDRRFAAESLVRVLADWAARNPLIAALHEREPPLSVQEDLLVIGGAATREAVTALGRRVTAFAVGPTGVSPMGVLNAVHAELMELLGLTRVPLLDGLVKDLTESLAAVAFHMREFDADDRRRVADEVAPYLREALDVMMRTDRD
jgi:hypothetical protein